MILLQLMFEFCKTGLFSVGGGLATLPFLYEMAEKTGWFTNQDILNLIAISESTPGAIGINMSTYVGFLTSGVPGAICATLALAAPSVVIIVLIAKCMDKFKNSPIVAAVFKGLRPASTGLIVAAGLSVAQMAFLKGDLSHITQVSDLLSDINFPAIALAVVLFVLLRKFKLHPILYIAAAAVIGYVFQL